MFAYSPQRNAQKTPEICCKQDMSHFLLLQAGSSLVYFTLSLTPSTIL